MTILLWIIGVLVVFFLLWLILKPRRSYRRSSSSGGFDVVGDICDGISDAFD